ncbi:hypothetical protein B566_EDAN010741 [Ephemera danica]|nr:hypothetical protein B566_EDAN010741 [Ephemera danica]
MSKVCGFAGEASPRCVIPSEVKCKTTGTVKKVFDYANAEELYHTLVEFIHTLYFKYLLVTPKDRKVVIVESLLCPTIERETLAQVLFLHYDVATILTVPSHLVSLYTLAVPTAIVLDVGYKEAVLIPIFENTPVLHSFQALALAGEAVNQSLQSFLEDQPGEGSSLVLKQSEPLPESVIEDIKIRACFVTTMDRAQMIQASQKESSVMAPTPPLAVKYPLQGQRLLNVPGVARECAYEVLEECPVDTRVALAENILLVGGTVMAPGFKARLQQELQDQLVTPRYLSKLAIKRFCFHTSPSQENYTCWLGGAILGATNAVNKNSVSKETYSKQKRLPDWPDLSVNISKQG